MSAVRARYPVRLERPLTIGVDVDLTILFLREGVKAYPHENAARSLQDLVHDQVVVDRLQALERIGFQLRFITLCKDGVRDSRVQLLQSAGFRHVDDRLANYPWTGDPKKGREDKRDELLDHDCVLMIGDTQIDRLGAALAGIPFMNVRDFRRGESLDNLFCWKCGDVNPDAWSNVRTCTSCARPHDQVLQVMA